MPRRGIWYVWDYGDAGRFPLSWRRRERPVDLAMNEFDELAWVRDVIDDWFEKPLVKYAIFIATTLLAFGT